MIKISRRRKRQEQPKEKNADPKTQKLPETIQGEETRKPENYRTRRRRESQLTTAAPLESSTLRWIPRKNALQVHEASAIVRGIQRNVDDSRGATVVS